MDYAGEWRFAVTGLGVLSQARCARLLDWMSMTIEAEDPAPEARKLPTGRIARTARVGGLVTGQGVRWAGMRTANRVRSPERADRKSVV